MRRVTNVDAALDDFLNDIIAILDLVEDIDVMLSHADAPISGSKSDLRREQIHEFAYLKLILSWEVFLEHTLVLYMMGKKSSSGYQPNPKVKNIKNKEIAYILLSGKRKYNIGKDYLPYLSDPEQIEQIAGALFHSHCYDFSLSNQISDKKSQNPDLFGHARYIRNHIAHRSRSSEANFKSTVGYFLRKKHDCTVGGLLMEGVREEMEFGDFFVDKDFSYLGAYCAYFSVLAENIVHYDRNKKKDGRNKKKSKK